MPSQAKISRSDRNLLFGLLALQFQFIDADGLLEAMQNCVVTPDRMLGQLLLEQKKVTAEQFQGIEQVLAEFLETTSSAKRLVQKDVLSTVLFEMEAIKDDDLQRTITRLKEDLESETVDFRRSEVTPNGRFRIGDFYRAGGLGEVFKAEDLELHREVALKEIKPFFADNPLSRSRFILEAEITGGLEHPGIVPVYGLGLHASGRPYYAMRFIRGQNLKHAIAEMHKRSMSLFDQSESTLELKQLLRRFIDVCNAVAYAHNRGVLHRDIKPANIMLGKFGETLVVDWGLAKTGVSKRQAQAPIPTEEPEGESPLTPASASTYDATQMGSKIGTPPYMSPEQAEGRLDDMGPASDIYSLGSTLYSIITNKRPYDGVDNPAILEKVSQGRYTPISEVKSGVPPELVAICSKAMELRPENRYPTATELGLDLYRWIADEPVQAYPEPWTRRAWRWGQRHRSLLTGTATLLITAVIALAVSTALIAMEQRETENQRQIAVDNMQMSQNQAFEVTKMLESIEDSLVVSDQRKRLYEQTSDVCQRLLAQRPRDTEIKLLAAKIHRYRANLHRILYELPDAEKYYSQALALRLDLQSELPNSTENNQDIADIEREHGHLYMLTGNLGRARQKYQQSVHWVESKLTEKNSPSYLRRLALGLAHVANVDFHTTADAHSDQALATLRLAESHYRVLMTTQKQSMTAYDPAFFAALLTSRAAMHRDRNEIEQALALHREVVEIVDNQIKRIRINNASDLIHFEAQFRIDQAQTWIREGSEKSLTKAETNLGAAINQMTFVSNALPMYPYYRETIANALRRRAELRCVVAGAEKSLDLDRWNSARMDYEVARDMMHWFRDRGPQVPHFHFELAKIHWGLGQIARVLMDQEPEAHFEIALAYQRKAIELSPEDRLLKRPLSQPD